MSSLHLPTNAVKVYHSPGRYFSKFLLRSNLRLDPYDPSSFSMTQGIIFRKLVILIVM